MASRGDRGENGARRAKSPVEDDQTSDEDDDLEAPKSRSVRPHSSAAAKPVIGGVRGLPSRVTIPTKESSSNGSPGKHHRSTSPDRRAPVRIKEDNDGTKTTSPMAGKLDSRTARTTRSPSAQPSDLNSPSKLTVKRLGQIGGGTRATSTPHVVAPTEKPAVASSHSQNHKLGLIGRSPQNAAASETKPARDRFHQEGRPDDGRSKASKPADLEPEETAEERADRKREELKRQLEGKGQAPTKKKRKF